jgi:hypothetical protein
LLQHSSVDYQAGRLRLWLAVNSADLLFKPSGRYRTSAPDGSPALPQDAIAADKLRGL